MTRVNPHWVDRETAPEVGPVTENLVVFKGYVYVLKNPHVVGMVKVGKTTLTPEKRAAQLSTGSPGGLIVHRAFAAENCHMLEKKAHEALARYRQKGSEWFRCTEELACQVIASELLMLEPPKPVVVVSAGSGYSWSTRIIWALIAMPILLLVVATVAAFGGPAWLLFWLVVVVLAAPFVSMYALGRTVGRLIRWLR